MKRQPGAIFIVDPHRERIAVTEANKLEIPVVGTGDTNVDPDELDFIIPANDDAIRSIRLLCQLVADAAIEGRAAAGRPRSSEPEVAEQAAPDDEPEFDEAAAADLVAQLAAGGTLSFDPESDDDELLPGAPKADERRHRTRTRRELTHRARARGRRRRPGRPGPAARRGRPATPTPTRAAPRRAPHTTGAPRDDGRSRPRPSRSCASAPAPASWTASARSRRPAATSTRPSRSLREQGLAAAAKKAGRDAREGLVSSYIHTGGRLGVLIEVNCETDFVARTDEFQKLVRDLAMQVAGLAPLYVDVDSHPGGRPRGEEGRAARRRDRRRASPRPSARRSSRASSRSGTSEVCLLEQPFRDEERTRPRPGDREDRDDR